MKLLRRALLSLALAAAASSKVSAASVDRSLRGVGVLNEEFDTSEEQQLQLHVVAAVDGLKAERQLDKSN